MSPKPLPLEALERLKERIAVLAAAADLFEEVAAFMDTVTPRTFDDYDKAEPGCVQDALRLKHMQALRIRDDYRSSAKENRDDVAILEAQGERLREVEGALEPFVNYARYIDDGETFTDDSEIVSALSGGIRQAIRFRDLRRAKAALTQPPAMENGE